MPSRTSLATLHPRGGARARAWARVLLALAVIVVAGACGAGGGPTVTAPPAAARDGDPAATLPQPRASDGRIPGDRAPEFTGLTGWVNSEPLTLAALGAQHRVVLIDFWTYSCVNCLRTLPYLRAWDAKYRDHGLTIVGVHSPEFEFERDPDNVAAAVRAQGLEYPVAIDSEMATWRAWGNRVWPAKYLVSAGGAVRYVHFGEGRYDETEEAIRRALIDAGRDVSDVAPGGVTAPALDADAGAITRELYGGYERNFASGGVYAAQDDYYLGVERVGDYVDPGAHGHDQWYLHGTWRNDREAIVHARETAALEDYFAFRFAARSVNVVMAPAPGGAYDVIVELDGRPLDAQTAGADVRFDGAGRTVVRVAEPRMYAVVELPVAGDHELTLRSNAEGFSIFAVAFGAYEEGA